MLAPKKPNTSGHHPHNHKIQEKKPFVLQRQGQNAGIQEKLKVGQPNDRFEKEADSVADNVVSKSETPKVEASTTAPIQTMKVGSGDLAQRALRESQSTDVAVQKESQADVEAEAQLSEKSGTSSTSVPQGEVQLKEEEEVQLQEETAADVEPVETEAQLMTDSSPSLDVQLEAEIQAKTEPEPVQAKIEEAPVQKKEIKHEPLKPIIAPPVQLKTEVAPEEEVQMKEDEEKSDEAESVQLKSKAMDSGDDVSSQIASSKGGGSTMDDTIKSDMESGFGHDFSGVRIHTDSQAAGMSSSLGARAFTTGNDIYFNEGEYRPDTKDGKHLLAHELTHTLQQGASGNGIQRRELKPKLIANNYFGGVPGYTFDKLKEVFGSDGGDQANMLLLDQISLIIHINKEISPQELWLQIITDVRTVDGFEAYEILRGKSTLPASESIELKKLNIEDAGNAFDAADYSEVDFIIKKHSLKRKKKRLEEESNAEQLANEFVSKIESEIQLTSSEAEASKIQLDTSISNMLNELQNTINSGSLSTGENVSAKINGIKSVGISAIDKVRDFYKGSISEIRRNTNDRLEELAGYRDEKLNEISALNNIQQERIDLLFNNFSADIKGLVVGYNAEIIKQTEERYESHRTNGRFKNKTEKYKAEAAVNVGRKVNSEVISKSESTINAALGSHETINADNPTTKADFNLELTLNSGNVSAQVRGAYRDTENLLNDKATTDQRAALIILEDYKILIDEIVILTIQNQLNNKEVFDENQITFVRSKDSALREYYSAAVNSLIGGQKQMKGRVGQEMESFIGSQGGTLVPKTEDLDASLARTNEIVSNTHSESRTNHSAWKTKNAAQLDVLTSLMRNGQTEISSTISSAMEKSQTRGSSEIETTKNAGIAEQKQLRVKHLNSIIYEVGNSKTTMDANITEFKQTNEQQIVAIKASLKERMQTFKDEAQKIVDGLETRMDKAESEVWTKKGMRERRPSVFRDLVKDLVGTEGAYKHARKIKEFHNADYLKLSKVDWTPGVFTLDFIRVNINGMKNHLQPFKITPNEYFRMLWEFDWMFRKLTSQAGIDLMNQYKKQFVEFENQLKKPELRQQLFNALNGYRASYGKLINSEVERYELDKTIESKSYLKPANSTKEYKANLSKGKELENQSNKQAKVSKSLQTKSRFELKQLYDAYPIFNDEDARVWKRIDKYDLYKAKTPEQLVALLTPYINKRKKDAMDARSILYKDYGSQEVYNMDTLLPYVMDSYGMSNGTFPAQILMDFIGDKQDADARWNRFLLIVTIMVGILTSGIGTAIGVTGAGATLLTGGMAILDISLAVDQFKDFEKQYKLSKVGLASEPSVFWLIVGLAAAGISAGPLMKSLQAVGKAQRFKGLMKKLDASGDTIKFQTELRALLKDSPEELDEVLKVIDSALNNRRAYYEAIENLNKLQSSGQMIVKNGFSFQAAKELRTVALERIKYELKNFDDYKLYLQTTGKIDASLSSELLENLKSIWSKADDEAASAVAKYGDEVVEELLISTDDLIRTERGRTWKISTERVAEIIDSAKTNGIKEPIDVYVHNGKTYILNGHHRVEAARRLGIDIPVNKLNKAELATYNHTIFSLQQDAFAANQLGFKIDGRMLDNLLSK